MRNFFTLPHLCKILHNFFTSHIFPEPSILTCIASYLVMHMHTFKYDRKRCLKSQIPLSQIPHICHKSRKSGKSHGNPGKVTILCVRCPPNFIELIKKKFLENFLHPYCYIMLSMRFWEISFCLPEHQILKQILRNPRLPQQKRPYANTRTDCPPDACHIISV